VCPESKIQLRERLYHNSYSPESEIARKTELYGHRGRQNKTKEKPKIAVAVWSFFGTYISQPGVLDGILSLRIASMNARTSYIKYSSDD